MYTKSLLTLLTVAAGLLPTTYGHMHLHDPPTLKGANNPNTQGAADPYLDYPYGCCGKAVPGPCKGHIADGVFASDEGKPVATWKAGSPVTFTLAGTPPLGGNHYGGSCQAGFSTDGGKTFKVAASWEGDCPHRNNGIGPQGQSFNFTVPADLPSGERQIFAWTWVNREQEFNMGCASVTITGGDGTPSNTTTPTQSSAPAGTVAPSGVVAAAVQPSSSASTYTVDNCACSCPSKLGGSCQCQCPTGSKARRIAEAKIQARHYHVQKREAAAQKQGRATESVAWASRPDMLFSDYQGAECTSPKTSSELKYPNPGPNVVQGDGEYPLELPSGSSC